MHLIMDFFNAFDTRMQIPGLFGKCLFTVTALHVLLDKHPFNRPYLMSRKRSGDLIIANRSACITIHFNPSADKYHAIMNQSSLSWSVEIFSIIPSYKRGYIPASYSHLDQSRSPLEVPESGT